MGLRRLDAVVLRLRDLGEADRLVTLFGPDIGKRTGVARGARRIRSRLAGTLQPTHVVRITVFEREGRELFNIDQADLLERYDRLRQDLDRLLAALDLLALVDRFSQEGEPAPALFDLLRSVLGALDGAGHPEALKLAFQIRFLAYSGFSLELEGCVRCGRPGEGELDPQAGGLVCSRCGGGAPTPRATVSLLQGLLGAPVERIARGRPDPERLEQGIRLVTAALEHHF